ncbi:MAG: DNA polymerase Y family protein [Pseudomonadota bacterium]
MGRRIVSVWLPRLEAESALRREPNLLEAPLAILAEERRALRVRSLLPLAERRGVRRGMGAADARALCPELVARPADPIGVERLLASLTRWARRFTPWVAPDADATPGEGGLNLDVTGCAHLFGGEAALLRALTAGLSDLGFTARAAAADAKGAAWALSRHGAPEAIAPPGEARAAIEPLPLASLRLSETAVAGLNRLGVKTAGEMLRLPRASLARRFGAQTLRRLDQALGAEPEPISPAAAAPRFAVRMSLPEPVGLIGDLQAGLDRLLTRLCEDLRARGMGARRLRFTVRRVDQREQSVEIGLARPGRSPEIVAPLFARGLEKIEAGFGVDALRLAALVVEPLSEVQTHAGPDRADPRAADALDALLTRLGGRLGFERLTRPRPADTHDPDKAVMWDEATLSSPAEGWREAAAARPPRPIARTPHEPIEILAPGRPPARFRWRGRALSIKRAVGPERIAPEWWLNDPAWRSGVRDYWRIETNEGPRLWLFETPQIAPEDGPLWRVAGIFA